MAWAAGGVPVFCQLISGRKNVLGSKKGEPRRKRSGLIWERMGKKGYITTRFPAGPPR